MENYVKLENVTKVYKMGEVEIRAADGIDFSISKGEFVVIVGPSGAGKTTVLTYFRWNGYSHRGKSVGRRKRCGEIHTQNAYRVSQKMILDLFFSFII